MRSGHQQGPYARPAPRAPTRGARRGRLGREGEQLAAEHLLRLGCRLLERNARTRWGEIDLIVQDGTELVFVEVKTLRARPRPLAPSADARTARVQPLAGLRERQRRRLRRLAGAWLAERTRRRPTASAIRFDAIGVVLDERGRLLRLDHLKAAW
jgi:putative endonuclease